MTNGYSAPDTVGPVIVGSAGAGAGNMNPSEDVAVGRGSIPGFVLVAPPESVAVPVRDPVHSDPLGQHAMLFPASCEQTVPDRQQTSELPRSLQGLWPAGQLSCRFTSLKITSGPGSGSGSGCGLLMNGEWKGERSIAKAVVERREAVRKRAARMLAVGVKAPPG